MSRPRKPTSHLELVGAFDKNPQRRREGEPVSDESAIAPDVLSDDAKKVWAFLIDTAVPGVLQKQDSAFLALACEAVARVWYGTDVSMTEIKDAGGMLVRLGLTPTERSKVVVPKKDKPNVFKELKK